MDTLLGLEQRRVFQGLKMWPRGRRGMSLYQQCFNIGLSSQIVTVSLCLCRDWVRSFLGGVTLWCSGYHTLSGYHGEEETCKSEHQSLHRALRLWYSETKRVDVNLAYTAQVYACFVHTVSEVRFPVTNMAGTQFVLRMPAMFPRFPGSPKFLSLFGLCCTLLGRKMSLQKSSTNRKMSCKYEIVTFSALDHTKGELSLLTDQLKAAAVVAFSTLLKSAGDWQMHMTWSVYTCLMGINSSKKHISSTHCEKNNCYRVMS